MMQGDYFDGLADLLQVWMDRTRRRLLLGMIKNRCSINIFSSDNNFEISTSNNAGA